MKLTPCSECGKRLAYIRRIEVKNKILQDKVALLAERVARLMQDPNLPGYPVTLSSTLWGEKRH